jgi:hypothetical protein
MKIKASIALGLLFAGVWFVSGGYRYIPFINRIGMDSYAKKDVGIGTTTPLVATSTGVSASSTVRIVTHIPTPKDVKAIYMSSWVASSKSFRDRLIALIDTTELNAVVIDVKDNTGLISWEGRVKDMNALLDELHSKNIYVIARVAVFQDPAYVKAHPEEAIHSKSTGGIWRNHKGEPWVDAGSKNMWKHTEVIAKEAYARGFDEINLDYIRFPTDGRLSDMTFPVSGERAFVDKPGIIDEFYAYITSSLRKDGIPVSGDLFGIIMITKVDIAVLGQDMHSALTHFDYVAPMVYPSHFYSGTAGYQNPAAFPGEIIAYSMGKGMQIADEVASSTGFATSTIRAKYRPWYQDFDMGATYTKEMVRAQITAGERIGINSWMLWDPANKYTKEALKAE